MSNTTNSKKTTQHLETAQGLAGRVPLSSAGIAADSEHSITRSSLSRADKEGVSAGTANHHARLRPQQVNEIGVVLGLRLK